MKRMFLVFIIFVYVNADDNITKPSFSKENLGIPMPLEKEFESVKMIHDKAVNYEDTIKELKKSYSKPLKDDFSDLDEFEKSME